MSGFIIQGLETSREHGGHPTRSPAVATKPTSAMVDIVMINDIMRNGWFLLVAPIIHQQSSLAADQQCLDMFGHVWTMMLQGSHENGARDSPAKVKLPESNQPPYCWIALICPCRWSYSSNLFVGVPSSLTDIDHVQIIHYDLPLFTIVKYHQS